MIFRLESACRLYTVAIRRSPSIVEEKENDAGCSESNRNRDVGVRQSELFTENQEQEILPSGEAGWLACLASAPL